GAEAKVDLAGHHGLLHLGVATRVHDLELESVLGPDARVIANVENREGKWIWYRLGNFHHIFRGCGPRKQAQDRDGHRGCETAKMRSRQARHSGFPPLIPSFTGALRDLRATLSRSKTIKRLQPFNRLHHCNSNSGLAIGG